MSDPQTGATDEQIEAAGRMAIRDEVPGITDREIDAWLANQTHTPDTALMTLRKAARFLVQPGQVIVDARLVPTADEIEAMKSVSYFEVNDLVSAEIFDSYLDRVLGVQS